MALERGEILSKAKKLELDMKHRESPPLRPSIGVASELELKALPTHMVCIFGRDDSLPVIIASDFNVQQVECF